MTEHRRLQTRLGLAYLTATFLPLGLWATFATRSFYDDFPGSAGGGSRATVRTTLISRVTQG